MYNFIYPTNVHLCDQIIHQYLKGLHSRAPQKFSQVGGGGGKPKKVPHSYKYKRGNHVWDSLLCKLNTCFDSHMSHNITVDSEGFFISDLCLIRDDYTVFNNCATTKEELNFLIKHLCTS